MNRSCKYNLKLSFLFCWTIWGYVDYRFSQTLDLSFQLFYEKQKCANFCQSKNLVKYLFFFFSKIKTEKNDWFCIRCYSFDDKRNFKFQCNWLFSTIVSINLYYWIFLEFIFGDWIIVRCIICFNCFHIFGLVEK